MAACVWQYSLRLQIICSIHFWLDWNGGRCFANSLFNQDKTRSSFNNLAILFQTVYGIYQTTSNLFRLDAQTLFPTITENSSFS